MNGRRARHADMEQNAGVASRCRREFSMIRCVTDIRAQLGECPVWSPDEKVVYWIDIQGRKLHRTDPESGNTTTINLPSRPGMTALRKKGGLIVVLEAGVYACDPRSGALDLLVPLEADRPENRANDGKCDAAGRLWVGTMNVSQQGEPTGNFYRIDPDLTVTKLASNFRIPNGLAWSPDEKTMLHTDSRAGVVWRYAFDAATGRRGDEETFFRFDRPTMGGVDGAAMDRDGGYWPAMYGGSKLLRVRPDGIVEREIPLPVSQPTMPAFGGADMKTLFVTSACQNLSEGDRQAQPFAGGLLAVETEFVGHPVHAFGG
jgi:sugar lactone lactonase YvrE